MPPREYAGRFGIRPKSPRDYEFLFDLTTDRKGRARLRDVLMARDCYDDCISSLDDQLGRLLDELHGKGLLDNTLVIITSDHGESFGDHGVFGHGTGLYLDQIAVPLVILSPGAPAGRVVADPVSLRDLPATVVDQLGLSAGSPFPGHSLAAFWSSSPGQAASGDHPSPYGTRARQCVPASTSKQPAPRGIADVPGGPGPALHPGRHGVRATLRPEARSLREGQSHGLRSRQPSDGAFRRMLLKVLTDNPGSIEVENAYLKPYKQWLNSLVHASSPPREPLATIESR